MSQSTIPSASAKPYEHPEPALDPFGMILNPADLLDWPPADSAELARLDAWTDACEREAAERDGNGDAG
jgi:hypothetical protein